METRANYALIGLFTLVIVAGAFFFVYWFAATDTGRQRTMVEIVFTGSVSGLSRGAAVTFNGIRVGEVTSLAIDPENPANVLGRVAVDLQTPLRADTSARLEFAGLTGIANVALIGGDPAAPPLVPAPNAVIPRIQAEPSEFQDLIESARNIAQRASDVFDRFDSLVAQNDQAVAETVQNVRVFSQALADNAPAIDRFLEQVGAAAERVGPLAESLDALAVNVNQVIAAVDAESVARSVSNVESFTEALAGSRERIDSVFADASQIAERLNAAAGGVEDTVESARAIVAAIDAGAIEVVVANVRDFSQTLADSRGEVARITENAASLTETLTRSAGRLDATLENVEGVSQTFADNREAIARILAQAADLTERLNETSLALQSTIEDVGAVVAAVDPARVAATVGDVEAFARTLAQNRESVSRIVANAETLTRSLAGTAGRVDETLGRVDGLVAAVDPQAIGETVENARAFSQTLADNREALARAIDEVVRIAGAIDADRINRVVENAERFTAALGDQSESIEVIVANATEISQKLNASADRVDRVLAAAESFLGSAEDETQNGLFDDIRGAAAAIRDLATNLDTRTAEITGNLARFTGPGLQEYRALAEEGRRTLSDISRAVRALERDPSQLIFGGDAPVQEFRGRR